MLSLLCFYVLCHIFCFRFNYHARRCYSASGDCKNTFGDNTMIPFLGKCCSLRVMIWLQFAAIAAWYCSISSKSGAVAYKASCSCAESIVANISFKYFQSLQSVGIAQRLAGHKETCGESEWCGVKFHHTFEAHVQHQCGIADKRSRRSNTSSNTFVSRNMRFIGRTFLYNNPCVHVLR